MWRRIERMAKRGYWLNSREAGAEVGVSARRMRQIAEELRIPTKEAPSSGGPEKVMRGCCVDAAKDRQRCDVEHDEEPEPEDERTNSDRSEVDAGRARGTERPSFTKSCQAESPAMAQRAA
jgi:hypothetical protein